MSVISWGKCTIKYATSTAGVPGTSWTALEIPVDGSTSIETTAGDTKEAKQEGGALVDSVTGSPVSSLVFDLFVKKSWYNSSTSSVDVPLSPADGVVTGNYAFRVVPEDDECIGIQIDNSTVTTEILYSSAEGLKVRYTCKALTPATGDMIKFGMFHT